MERKEYMCRIDMSADYKKLCAAQRSAQQTAEALLGPKIYRSVVWLDEQTTEITWTRQTAKAAA
jgi:hypothetical protein